MPPHKSTTQKFSKNKDNFVKNAILYESIINTYKKHEKHNNPKSFTFVPIVFMTSDILLYSILGILTFLATFSLFIGVEKMIKLVIGNHILMSIILPLSICIEMASKYFGMYPTQKFLGISFSKWQLLFANGKITIVLAIYIICLLLLLTKSTLHILLPQEERKRIVVLILLVPLTVFSIIFSLEVILFGPKILLPDALMALANKVGTTPFVKKFILLTPLRISMHSIVTLIVTTQFRIGFSFQKKQDDFQEET